MRADFVPLLFFAFFYVNCLYGPPILTPPEELDVPPVIVETKPMDVIQLDRSLAGEISFEMLEARDANLNDEIEYRMSIIFSLGGGEIGELVVATGLLRARQEQSSESYTVYDRVVYNVLPCDPFFSNPALNTVTIKLRLIDQIPPSQHTLTGQEEYIVDQVWNVELTQICPQ